MQAATTSRHRRQRGAALVELVLTVPLFVVCIYGSQYLAELGTAKLEAQEIARYAAWAFAVQPLGDARGFDHDDAFERARHAVARELVEVYSRGTDGAGNRPRAGTTLAAVYEPPVESDLRNSRVGLLPDRADVSLAGDATPVGRALERVGTSRLSPVFDVLFENLGLNLQGRVTARARVRLLPPARRADARRAAAITALTGRGGLRELPPGGWVIRDAPGRPMQTTIVADPWRVTQGWTAGPGDAAEEGSYYANAVRGVAGALDLLELGAGLLRLDLPDEVEAAVGGLGRARVFSRPYTAGRGTRPAVTRRGQLEAGQVDIFASTDSDPQEPGAVRRFETMPLYDDPEDVEASAYLKTLRLRGDNFRGCTLPQARECRP